MKGRLDKGHNNEFRLLNERLLNGGESLIPIDSLINTTKASFAAIESLREHKWVEI